MLPEEMHFNDIYKNILKNSLFTERQTYIIYKRLATKKNVISISRGAYYRQLRQCRHKIISILYSILLLQHVGAIDRQSLSVLQGLSNKLGVIPTLDKSDVTDPTRMESVTLALENALKKMCNV
jgi:hypothetical protein